jgi:hypothetical protein
LQVTSVAGRERAAGQQARTDGVGRIKLDIAVLDRQLLESSAGKLASGALFAPDALKSSN